MEARLSCHDLNMLCVCVCVVLVELISRNTVGTEPAIRKCLDIAWVSLTDNISTYLV